MKSVFNIAGIVKNLDVQKIESLFQTFLMFEKGIRGSMTIKYQPFPQGSTYEKIR
jgi:hypothetical protein